MRIDTLFYMTLGLFFIEIILHVIKGFYFYRTSKEEDHTLARKSWRTARRMTYLAIAAMSIVFIIYLLK